MRFWLATALEGELTLCSDSALPHVTLRKGRSALIPAGCEVELAPTERAEVFLGTVPLLGSDQIE
jgi:quercetin dioxygenase-like cupin family protein